MDEFDFYEWLQYGMDAGWVGPVVCETHDGLPMTAEEEEAFWESDPCIRILRVYESPDHGKEVEAHHSPSTWRQL
jgi:hypothetical protein